MLKIYVGMSFCCTANDISRHDKTGLSEDTHAANGQLCNQNVYYDFLP